MLSCFHFMSAIATFGLSVRKSAPVPQNRHALSKRMAQVAVRVLYFAGAREASGKEGEDLELASEGLDERGKPFATTDALAKVLVSRHEDKKPIRAASSSNLQPLCAC